MNGQIMNSIADEHLGVVVVDDDPIFRDFLCSSLSHQSKFAMFEAGSGEELENVLATQRIDCIALDYDLGDESGLLIKQRIDEGRPEHPPVILMTGVGSEMTAVRAFRMGVADYLAKGAITAEIFVDSVLRVVERERKQSYTKSEHRKLAAASGIDFVTGLEGKARLDERMNQLAAMPAAARSVYALILIELVEYDTLLEGFELKTVDLALRAFASKLRQLIRTNDVVGRYANGTFLVIATIGQKEEPLEKLCQRLSRDLAHRIKLDVLDIAVSAVVKGQFCTLASPIDPSGAIPAIHPLLTLNDGSGTKPGADASERLDSRPAADVLRGADRRASIRQRVFKRGLMHILGADGVLHCHVRNLSDGGAGLRVDFPFAAPEFFDLEIVGSGETRRVQRRWQTGVNLGVQFLSSPKSLMARS